MDMAVGQKYRVPGYPKKWFGRVGKIDPATSQVPKGGIFLDPLLGNFLRVMNGCLFKVVLLGVL